MNDKTRIAEILLDLKAVSPSPMNPFTWASGMRSPIYCDNRLIISNVKARRAVIAAFVRLLENLEVAPEVVAGTATAGIPHAAWLAESLSLPMIYVRSSEKKHGKQNRIEGKLNQGAKVIVIEDLISTGGSSVSAARGIQEAGGEVLGVVAIFQYGMDRARNTFGEAGIAYDTLTDLATLLDVAVEKGYLTGAEKVLMAEWRLDPAAWSEKHG